MGEARFAAPLRAGLAFLAFFRTTLLLATLFGAFGFAAFLGRLLGFGGLAFGSALGAGWARAAVRLATQSTMGVNYSLMRAFSFSPFECEGLPSGTK